MTYESYTRQALPEKKYRELLGSSLCVFNSNNSFIIENILKSDINGEYNWYQLIDMTSGSLSNPIKDTITIQSNTKIANLFSEIIEQRNRIVHSFQITDDNDGLQKLATKDKQHNQFIITEDYMYEFIEKNEKLNSLLHDYRGY